MKYKLALVDEDVNGLLEPRVVMATIRGETAPRGDCLYMSDSEEIGYRDSTFLGSVLVVKSAVYDVRLDLSKNVVHVEPSKAAGVKVREGQGSLSDGLGLRGRLRQSSGRFEIMCRELLVNQSTKLRAIRRQRYIVRKSGVPDGDPVGVVRQPTQSIHQVTSSLGVPGRFVHPIVPRPTSPPGQSHPVVDIAYSPVFERGQVRIRAGQRCNGSGLHILACRSEPLAGRQHAHGMSPRSFRLVRSRNVPSFEAASAWLMSSAVVDVVVRVVRPVPSPIGNAVRVLMVEILHLPPPAVN